MELPFHELLSGTGERFLGVFFLSRASLD
jgi:hypothetical protein